MIEEKTQGWSANKENENACARAAKKEIGHISLGNRQIRTKSTVFSFHIFEMRGALSLDLMGTLKRFKPILDYAARRWKLPRLIRILVSDTIWSDSTYLGAKLMPDARRKPYFDIHINLENLHEAELQFTETSDFMIQGILMLFLHECAHFITKQEGKANSLAEELIFDYLRTRSSKEKKSFGSSQTPADVGYAVS